MLAPYRDSPYYHRKGHRPVLLEVCWPRVALTRLMDRMSAHERGQGSLPGPARYNPMGLASQFYGVYGALSRKGCANSLGPLDQLAEALKGMMVQPLAAQARAAAIVRQAGGDAEPPAPVKPEAAAPCMQLRSGTKVGEVVVDDLAGAFSAAAAAAVGPIVAAQAERDMSTAVVAAARPAEAAVLTAVAADITATAIIRD